jgi:5-deoxy-glucuronate isomerase
MDLLKKNQDVAGYKSVVDDPEICSYLNFGVLNLSDGDVYRGETAGNETCLVILGGKCDVIAGEEEWKGIGERGDVFDGAPYSVYLPRDYSFSVTGIGKCGVAICSSAAESKRDPRLIKPEDVKCRDVGKWNWKRRVCDIMGNDSEIPESLIVGETYNPPGNWSSAPPHKHDVDDLPRESSLEEIYFYKLKPSQGFALQRVYTPDGELNDAYVVEDGDTVAIPRGYHPVVAGPGYQLYYLWMLAGTKRIMCPNDDPDHAWLKNCEPLISEIR